MRVSKIKYEQAILPLASREDADILDVWDYGSPVCRIPGISYPYIMKVYWTFLLRIEKRGQT